MSLNPRFILGSLDLTEWPFMVKRGDGGVDTGAPENVSTIIASLLQDGEIVSVDRSSNRTLSLTVYIEEADLAALSDAETLLIAETSKPRNTFSIDPGDGYGAVTVFDTFRVQERFVRSDDEEEVGLRRYDLTIPALPFGRSETEIVSTALTSAVTPVTTVINDGSSATNWSSILFDSASPSAAGVSGGAVTGSLNPNNVYAERYESRGSLIYTPASPVDMSATSYVYVDWRVSLAGVAGSPVRLFADGIELVRVSSQAVPGGDYTRSFFVCPDASVASFRVKGPAILTSYGATTGPLSATLYVDQLVKTNQAPSSSTLRQKVQSLPVLGSARTQGSLQVSHETSALGDVIVYTYPDLGDDYTPDLRRWRTASGTVTADEAMVSGARNAWNGGVATVFTVPLRMLRPGPYLFVARVRRTSGTGDVTLSATGVSAVVNFPTVNAWQNATIGVINIGDHVPGTSFSQTITLSSALNIELDEAWLFYVGDDAHLTQASLGTGTPSASGDSNRLWIDTPTLAHPYPAMWRGTLADKTDARSALDANTEWADHTFSSPGVTLFTVTSNALDAAVTLRYYPRWFGNAGNVA